MILLFGANLEVEAVLANGNKEYMIFDDNPDAATLTKINGKWREGGSEVLMNDKRDHQVVCGVTSDSKARRLAIENLQRSLKGLDNWNGQPLVASTTCVVGVWLANFSLVLDMCYVGPHAILHEGAVMLSTSRLCHEAALGSCSIMAAGSTVLGHGKVGEDTYLGANSVVLPYAEIGSGMILGVGGAAKRLER